MKRNKSPYLYFYILHVYAFTCYKLLYLPPQTFSALKISSDFPTGSVRWVCLRVQGPLYILMGEKWLHPQMEKTAVL